MTTTNLIQWQQDESTRWIMLHAVQCINLIACIDDCCHWIRSSQKKFKFLSIMVPEIWYQQIYALQWSSAALQWSSVAFQWSSVAFQWSSVAFQWPSVAFQSSSVTFQWSSVAFQWSFVVFQWSSVAFHWSSVVFQWSSVAFQWSSDAPQDESSTSLDDHWQPAFGFMMISLAIVEKSQIQLCLIFNFKIFQIPAAQLAQPAPAPPPAPPLRLYKSGFPD